MARFETAQLTVSRGKRGEDRVAVIQHDDRVVVVVADGAGGVGSGDQAAEAVIREVTSDHLHVTDPEAWEAALRQIDFRVGAGESTAVAVDLRHDSIVGASVGDSRAWIIHEGELVDLTVHQIRKPLLGSGQACPKRFSHGPLIGTLIVATDGYCDYVKRDRLISMVHQSDLCELPRRCVELARLPSGDLWDDIGIVVCRAQRPHRTRERYTI